MKNVIVETDIGHDPDDFFALCYLHSAGVQIRAITIHKGEPHQIALVRFLCKELGLDIPVGATKLDVEEPKKYEGEFEGLPVQEFVGFHHNLLTKYGYPHAAKADDYGHKVIADTLDKYPDSELFIIGAPKNVSTYLSGERARPIDQITFQGGFLGYDVHNIPCERLPKFEGKTTCPSYNPNGDIKGTELIVKSPLIKNIRFVSKNVCHTIVYDKQIHELMKQGLPKNHADELFMSGMDLYLSKHNEKKYHDPCAAVCMLHPEIAKWVRGHLYYEKGGWGTFPNEASNSETIACIDKERLWSFILDK